MDTTVRFSQSDNRLAMRFNKALGVIGVKLRPEQATRVTMS
jgi:hypothetical protein